ncbi:T9SS type A sorting domain-containing protein [Dyadobacter jiangsuensis]|uniref:Putative secreted protein (Por secretion system target) n=1 Tax=Dyadobacter jiangsuensis TaxID=1591085 RepID=A0A2P8FQJ7_9BACT|nr:T9SS type A sorting domain-containing protein [Dyadobacter jiangsuensis]PSL23979.1 putative secreted protein (Por secretion system target) [Dyadobacter jiangsuensis]
MSKFYACILAMWLCIQSAAFAQTPTISFNSDYSWNACLNTTYRYGINTTGTFNPDNKFSIQVRKAETLSVVEEVPATLTNGRLEFVLKDSVAYANISVQFRALASSPKVQSEWSYGILVYSKGRITLNPDNRRDTLNTFDIVDINFAGIGIGDIRVTLNDSSKFNLYGNPGGFTSSQALTVPGTYPLYNIAHAENNCGAMQVSGQYQPVINSTSVKTVSVSPTQICENSEVKVTFSTQGTAFTAQTRYRLRFKELYPTGTPKVIEVPATLQGNFLVGTFPAYVKLSNSQQLSVQVITSNPATVSSIAPTALTLYPKTGASFSTPSQTVDINSSIYLSVKTYGVPPFSVELTDGNKATSFYGDISFQISPTVDKNYSIKSVTSACGTVDITEPEVVRIKVRPGIRFAEGKQVVCAGPNMRVKFVSSAQLTDATRFKIGVSPGNGTRFFIDAKRSGDYLEFAWPAGQSGSYYHQYQIITTNPSLESQPTSDLVVQTTPTIRYSVSGWGSTTLTIPSRVSLNYGLDGGGPYTLEEADGTIKTTQYSDIGGVQMFVRQTTEYKVKSVSNGCFKNDNPASVTLKLQPGSEPAAYIEPLKNAICNNDSLEITFGTVGQFGAGNKFSIQVNQPCCDFSTLRVVEQGGKYKVKVAITQYFPYELEFRIASSNPVLFSNVERIRLHTPLTEFSLSPQGRPEDPQRYIINPTPAQLYLGSNSQIQSVTYTENGVEKKTVFSQNVNSVYVTPKSGETSTYVVKTASNECGTFPVDKTAYYRAMPGLLQITSLQSQVYCTGTPLSLSFDLVEGVEIGDPTYSLEISPVNTFDFKALVTGQKGKRFNTLIPDELPTGNYSLRVVSSDGSRSEPQSIQVSTPVKATLTADNSQADPVKVDAGQSVVLRIRTEGAPPIIGILSDNTRQELYNEQGWYVYPRKSQEYSILSISNVCGYGTATGKVNVSVNPKLVANTSSWSVCEGGSINVDYELMGDVNLSDGYVHFSIVDQNNKSTIRLDSTRTLKGSMLLKLPNTLPGSYYVIVCSVPKYGLTANLGVSVTTKPNVTLYGNTTINSGESTQLVIRSNKYNTDAPNFVLSDGTKGSIYTGVGALNNINVSPTKTTTYTIASITNACGNGIATGSATVEVNPPSERTVTVTRIITKSGFNACTGDTIGVDYKTAGTFSAGNTFTVQISDSTGRNFRNITTIGNAKPIQAVVPGDLSPTAQYRIRVTGSDPNTGSGAFGAPLTAMQKARARFASETVIFDGVNNPKVTVLLGGGGPWYYQFGTDGSVMNRQAYTSTDVVELFQASPSQYYRLFRVSNGCGIGIIESPSTVKVEVITATEPNAPAFHVVVAPNPVQDILTVKSENSDEKNIQLISQNGTVVHTIKTRRRDEALDIRSLSPGIYLLQVNSKGKNATFKVIKQ